MGFEDLPYHHSKIPPHVPERVNFLNGLEEQFEQDLLSNERYKEFFGRFQQNTIAQFCKAYAKHKRNLVEHYQYYIDKIERPKEVKYREDADGIFSLILQKKLFNQQLLWRAENVTYPEVQLAVDFIFWGNHIKDCPFIEPVSETEVAVMKQFLYDENFSHQTRFWLHLWQDYDAFMFENEEGEREDMPEWYEYYDGMLGTGALLLLPNTRAEKENFYRNIYSAWKRANVPVPSQQPYVPPPPYLHQSYQNYSQFINLFESDYLKEIHEGYLRLFEPPPDKNYDADAVEEAVRVLGEAEFPVYMLGGSLWHEAIIKCARLYKNKVIADEFDSVYEEYLMRRELQIGENAEKMIAACFDDPLHKIVLEQVIEGRKLNSEPADLSF